MVLLPVCLKVWLIYALPSVKFKTESSPEMKNAILPLSTGVPFKSVTYATIFTGLLASLVVMLSDIFVLINDNSTGMSAWEGL